MPKPRYKVVLIALAPDATDAGTQYADTTLEAVPEDKLRQLLTTLAGTAARLSPTVTFRPQARITSAAGLAMITVIEGKLYYGSWDTKGRGIEVSVDDIMGIVTGALETPKVPPSGSRAPLPMAAPPPRRKRKYFTIILLGAAIVAMNATTAWMLLKPPRTILPPHSFLPSAESDALMQQVAGTYQTGVRQGDRHLVIEPLGLFHFTVYGPNHTLTRERLQTGRAARTTSGVVILTNEFGVLRVIDPNTITIYGDTYHRIVN